MKPGIWQGPSKLRKKPDYAQEIKAMAMVAGKDIFSEVKLKKKRKGRGKDKGQRQFPEAELREDVKKWLDRHGWRYWRIENSITGRSTGLPDFLIAKDRMVFIELKGTGGLTGLQPEFQEWCKKCKMEYYIVRSEDDCDKFLTTATGEE